MSDTAYQHAMKRREELKRELSEIDEFLRLHRKFSVGSFQVEVVPPENVSGTKSDSTDTSDDSKATSRRVNPPREEVRRIAREVMLEMGRPLTRGELLEQFAARGTPIQGADPSKNMGTLMWRLSDHFVNIEGHGYWPRDVPCEAVEYDPADENSEEAIRHTLDLK